MRTGPTALFGGMLLIALIVFLPMRAVLGWVGVGDEGLVARRVSGTIWGATLTEARFGDLALGNLHARLSPLPLLVGRATIVFAGPEAASARPLRGLASVSRHGFGVDHMTATVATGRVFAPVPVAALDLDDVSVRFRTLGDYPLTGAVESDAATLPEIIGETLAARTSERQGRVIDKDGAGAMERKKQEGYF